MMNHIILRNVAARLVLRLDHRAHIKPALYNVFTGCLWRHEFGSRLPPWCTLL